MKHIKIKIMFFVAMLTILTAASAIAYSPNWYKEGDNWRIKDNDGNPIVNSWLYEGIEKHVLDANGNMLTGFAKVHDRWFFWN